jgi:hypothetical protein
MDLNIEVKHNILQRWKKNSSQLNGFPAMTMEKIDSLLVHYTQHNSNTAYQLTEVVLRKLNIRRPLDAVCICLL